MIFSKRSVEQSYWSVHTFRIFWVMGEGAYCQDGSACLTRESKGCAWGIWCHFRINKFDIVMDEQASYLYSMREFAHKTSRVDARGSWSTSVFILNRKWNFAIMAKAVVFNLGVRPRLDLPIGYVRLSLGPQDPRGPTANCGTHRANCRHMISSINIHQNFP